MIDLQDFEPTNPAVQAQDDIKNLNKVSNLDKLNKLIRLKRKMIYVKTGSETKTKKDSLPIVIEDQIESPLKSVLIIPPSRKEFVDLKGLFTNQLPRMNSLDTRQAALRECEAIIDQNITSNGLHVFLSTLKEYKRPANYSANEAEVFLLGIISDSFGLNLLEAQCNGKNNFTLLGSTRRLAELISRYFKDKNTNVQSQCSKTWKQIYRSQMLNASVSDKMTIIYEIPASFLLGGKDTVAQHTAMKVIESILEFAAIISDSEFVSSIANQFIPAVYLKSSLEIPQLVSCCRLIVETVKVLACELLSLIARQIVELSDKIIGQYHDSVIEVLQEVTKDKILKVQSVARSSLKEWSIVKKICDDLENQKISRSRELITEFDSDEERILNADMIIESKTQTNKADAQSILRKRPQTVLTNRVLFEDHGLKNILKRNGGLANEWKTRNFTRKHTGIGGGRTEIQDQKAVNPVNESVKSNRKMKQIILGSFNNLRGEQKSRQWQEIIRQAQYNVNQQSEDLLSQSQQGNDSFDTKSKGTDFNANNNNFYNSQLPNLLEIQKQQQQQLQQNIVSSSISASRKLIPTKSQETFMRQTVGFVEKEDYFLEETQDFGRSKNNNEKQEFNIPSFWRTIMKCVEIGDYDQAFSIVLDEQDDLYLIRLLMCTGVRLEKLRRETAVRVVSRYAAVYGLHEKLVLDDQREIQQIIRNFSCSSNPSNQKLAAQLSELNYIR